MELRSARMVAKCLLTNIYAILSEALFVCVWLKFHCLAFPSVFL